MTTLDAPGTTLWRSCSERVAEFSPEGARMATIGILSDGLGPNEVRVRLASGKVVGRYAAKWFGALVFENARCCWTPTARSGPRPCGASRRSVSGRRR